MCLIRAVVGICWESEKAEDKTLSQNDDLAALERAPGKFKDILQRWVDYSLLRQQLCFDLGKVGLFKLCGKDFLPLQVKDIDIRQTD